VPDPARYFLRDPHIRRLALCKVGANRQRVFLLKSGDDEQQVAAVAQLVKEPGDDWRVAYVPVAVPGAPEDQGLFGEKDAVDLWEPAEIAKAAHGFMANGGQIVGQHFDTDEQVGVALVENAVALADFEVGDQIIKQGTWYVGLEFDDPGLRKLVDEGEIDAVSVEGDATRQLAKAPLSAQSRKNLPTSAFVFPKERRYPIHDLAHARNALARSSGKPEEATVRAAVYRRYPELRKRAMAKDGDDDCPNLEPEDYDLLAKVSSKTMPDLDWSPAKNWIDRLPAPLGAAFKKSWIYRAAKHLVYEKQMPRSRAFAVAVNAAKRGCATGDVNFPGAQQVNAKSRAEMCAAVATWEAMKAANAGKSVAKLPDSDTLAGVDGDSDKLLTRIAKALGIEQREAEVTGDDEEGIVENPGSVEPMEIGDRVEALETLVKAQDEKLAALTADDGPLAKQTSAIEALTQRLPEPKPEEPTPTELKEALAKTEEAIGKDLKPLADRIAALEEGDSTQEDTDRELVAKSNGKGEDADARGILFDYED
jgi:hypothetical protein